MDKLTLILIALALCPPRALPQKESGEISPAARAYLDQALDFMQQEALHKKEIDWAELRKQTLAHATNAQTTMDTYPAIAYAISQLKERHSWFQLPDNVPPDRRQVLDTEIKAILARPDPDKPSPFMPSKEIKGHLIHGPRGKFAYVVVPMCIGRYAEWKRNGPDFQAFADKLHGLIADLAKQKPDGWIIDLRGNGGGNMWPMLAGIGAMVGDGNLGSFVSSDNEHTPWFYKAGKAGTQDASGREEISAEIKDHPLTVGELPWVAVLFDRGTGSSGEAIAISFAGRKRERSFGEHTAGFSTANDMKQLPDGAALFLCDGIEADRTGKLYPDGLDPDEKISAPGTRPSEDSDAALIAAEEWLGKQSAVEH